MTALDMDSFTTLRLRARPLGEGDEALYASLYTNPELMRYIAAPMSHEAACKSFRSAVKRQSPRPQRWIIAEREDGPDVGMLGLIGQGDGPEIGVMLLGPWHHRGYGTEAMAGMADHAFSTSAVQLITAHQAVADHPTVVRMMLKLGFEPLPPTDDNPQGGDWTLTRQQWLSRQPAPEPGGRRASQPLE